MNSLSVAKLGGGQQDLTGESLDSLVGNLDGSLILPGESAFDDATHIWNGSISKRPSAVVAAESLGDVIATVNFARHHSLEMSIKGGGHNIAGLALSDGGITLDLGRLNNVVVDVEAKQAKVGSGCTLGDVDRETQRHGLATTLGFVSATGVAGLTVGGGFGYLSRQFGWTVDSLVEVEVVTADGQVLRCSRTENDDLFWALRGGGGNFGVVTEFVFELHKIGPKVTAGLIAWSASEAEAVLDLYRKVTSGAPRALTVALLMRNAPPAPWLSEEQHGKPMVALVLNHTGTPEEAEGDLADIKSFGEPWADLIGVKDYVDQQAMLDATQPNGMHYYWKSEFLPNLSQELLETFRAAFVGMTAPANQAVLFHLGGRLNEYAPDDGAVGNRDAAYACVISAMTAPDASPEVEDANKQWVRNAWTELRAFSTGGNYINFQTDDEDDARAQESYGDNMERLIRIKSKYDPENFFRVNRNISPSMR